MGGGIRLCSPVAQVQEIVSHSAAAELGNRRQDSFELVPAYAFINHAHKFHAKPGFHTFLGAIALVNEQVKQFVHFRISKPELSLVCLTGPQVC